MSQKTPNIEHPTSNIQRRMEKKEDIGSSVRRSKLDVQCSKFGLFALALLLVARASADEPASSAPILQNGDRVAILGGTFVERMQTYGYVETALTALHPERKLTIRNLGWSGDEVTGIARALFGSTDDGFKRLVGDLELTKPTVVLVAYGANEAFGGPEKLEQFRAQLDRLLDRLGQTKARLVIVTPPLHENLGSPLPAPADYNKSLELYRAALLETAEKRRLPVIDLYSLISGDSATPAAIDRLTDNGLHLTGYGYWRAALYIARQLGDEPPSWTVDVEASGKTHEVAGTALTDVSARAQGVRFSALDERLPWPAPPKYSPEGAERLVPARLLRVRGLADGNYELLIDGHRVLAATAAELAKGVELHSGPELAQVERLRRAIGKKNELFFHRYRPENETYLFLFRKHEQGNNAVEIPKFDPLVEDQDQRIAELAQPARHEYELKKVGVKE